MIKEKKITNFDEARLLNLANIGKKLVDIDFILWAGSRATGQYNDLSDIDLFYLSNNPLDLIQEADILYEINRYLQTTEVDFVNLSKLSLKDQYKIICEGRLVYLTDEIKFSDYKEKLMMQYFDFKPVSDEYYRCFRENLKNGDFI